MYRAREIVRGALSLFLPNRCPFCGRIVRINEYWCESCYDRLPFLEEQPAPPDGVDLLLSVCRYRGRARTAILRMKKGAFSYSPEAFAVLMTELAGSIMADVDIITYVPSSFKRVVQLGYSHGALIARDIAFRSRKKCVRTAKVTSEKKEQKRLNSRQRRENARNSYKILDKECIKGKNILIVDDVSTTGATLSVLAEGLKMQGAAKVYAITFAQA